MIAPANYVRPLAELDEMDALVDMLTVASVAVDADGGDHSSAINALIVDVAGRLSAVRKQLAAAVVPANVAADGSERAH